MGYVRAWEQRRALTAVLVPVLVPAMLAALLLRLVAVGGDLVVVNGALLLEAESTPLAWLELIVIVVGWLLAVSSGVIVLSQPHTGTPTALRLAARALPAQLGWVLGMAALGLVTSFIAAALAPPGLVFLVIAGFVVVRMSLSVPALALGHLGGEAWTLSRSRMFRAVASLVVGALVIPLFLLWLTGLIGARIGVFGYAIQIPMLFAVVAVQAGTYAAVFQRCRDGVDEPEPVIGPHARREWRVVAALALPVILLVGVAVLNPGGAPELHVRRLDGRILDVQWPAGGHPVVITNWSYIRCGDAACAKGQENALGFSGHLSSGYGFTRDGLPLLVTMVSRSHLAEEIELRQCAGAGQCSGRQFKLEASREPVPLPRLAVTGAADGGIWVVVVRRRGQQPESEISFLKCADAKCDKPLWFHLGKAEGGFEDRDLEAVTRQVRLRVDPLTNAPHAEIDFGYHLVSARCASATCEQSTVERLPERVTGGLPLFLARVLTPRGDLYTVGAEQGPPESGFHLRIGSTAPQRQRLILWHCVPARDDTCTTAARVPLHVVDHPVKRVFIVAGPDNQLLIAEDSTLIALHPR